MVWRLAGHRTVVFAVAFSRDGRYLASGSHDKDVRLWDLKTGRCVRVCLGHTDWIRCVAFGPDGRLASAGPDRAVRLWDTETGQQTLALREHSDQVLGLAFSPDGRRLASCGSDGRVLLWDATPLDAAEAGGWAIEEDGLPVRGVGYTPDGQTLATTYEDGTYRLWDLETGWERPAPGAGGPALLFTGSGPPLPAGGTTEGPEGVRLVEAATGRERGRLAGSFTRLVAAALAPDGGTLATAEADRVRLWDPVTAEEKGSFRGGPAARGGEGRFTATALSPDGRLLVAGRQDGAVLLWDRSGAAGPAELGRHGGAVTAVLFLPDGRSLVSGGLDEHVRFWDVASGREAAPADVKAAVRSLALCPGRGVLAVGDAVGLVRLLDADSRRVLATLPGPTAAVQALAFAPDGRTLCLGSARGTVKLWPVDQVLNAGR
jgi:WD40 repeat protein